MDFYRMKKSIINAVNKFELNLTDLNIFTEAASGNYIVTPLIAAFSNAKNVWAFTRDSKYGTANDIKKNIIEFAEKLGIKDRITVVFEKNQEVLQECDIITNTGFVRPIDKKMISMLKKTAVLPLMWETWEYRKSDLDINECKNNDILVLGTNERDKRVNTFKYVGFIALKLLLQSNLEVYDSKILVIGSGYFLNNIINVLYKNGAHLFVFDLERESEDELERVTYLEQITNEIISELDAIVICEHKNDTKIIGQNGLLSTIKLNKLNPSLIVAHICGNVDESHLKNDNIQYFPKGIAPFGFMSLSTDYVGIKPLIDLHTAGLRVGEVMARSRIRGYNLNETIEIALKESPAMKFDSNIW